MRLISRHRQSNRAKAPRIAISQAEITADLHYRGGSRLAGQRSDGGRRGSGR